MKKNVINLLGLAFALVSGFSGCKNNTEEYVNISLNVENELSRKCIPDADGYKSSDVTYEFSYSGDESYRKTWLGSENIPSDIQVKTGTWDFALVAKKDEVTILSSELKNQTITAETNYLSFSLQLCDGTGTLNVNLTFPGNNYGVSWAACNPLSAGDSKSISFTDNAATVNLPSGYYLLNLKISYSLTGTAGTTTSVSELVQVAAGLTTTVNKTFEEEELNKIYSITYELADGAFSETDQSAVVYSYSPYDKHVSIPTPEKSGFTFSGWTVDSKTLTSSDGVYDLSDCSSDVTITANWEEETISGTAVESITTGTLSDGGTFTLTSDYTISETVEISSAVTITSSSKTIKRASTFTSGPMFKVVAGGSLTLQNITLDGGATGLGVDGYSPAIADTDSEMAVTDGPLIYNNGGTVDLGTGAILQHNYMKYNSSIYGGGAVYSDGGSVTVNGASICNNRYETDSNIGSSAGTGIGGGAIAVVNGELTINSGEIKNNSSNRNGGAIALLAYSTSDFAITNVGEITFTMNGGTISNNVCVKNGGGISIYNKSDTTENNGKKITVNLNDGEVSSNIQTDSNASSGVYGAGIYYQTGYSGSQLTMGTSEKQFVVMNNINNIDKAASGINVYLYGPNESSGATDVTLNNVLISGGNTTSTGKTVSGAGLYISHIKAVINDCEIKDNILNTTGTTQGIGLYVGASSDYATVTFKGGSISGNKNNNSTGTVDQVYVKGGTITWADGTTMTSGNGTSSEISDGKIAATSTSTN